MQTAAKSVSAIINQDAVDRFDEDGFLLVENFFSDEELDRLGAHVDAAVKYRTADDHRSHAEKNRPSCNARVYGKTMNL